MLDPEPIRFEWDISWSYAYWADLQQQLRREAEKQFMSLSELEWEHAMLEAAEHVHALLVNMMRLAMKQAVCLPEFQEPGAGRDIRDSCGEYLDHSVSVYREDRRAMEANEIRSWLEEKEEYAYSYQALTKVHLSDGDYSLLDFRYTAFRQIEMERSRLHGCVLVGTVWQESQLNGIDLTYSLLYGGDFSGCSMKGDIRCRYGERRIRTRRFFRLGAIGFYWRRFHRGELAAGPFYRCTVARSRVSKRVTASSDFERGGSNGCLLCWSRCIRCIF